MYTQDHYNVLIRITPVIEDLAEYVRDFVYDVAELATLIRSYGRVLSAMMRAVPTYAVRAYTPGGVVLGMQEWSWSSPARLYLPVDSPWIPWRSLPSATRMANPPDVA